MSHEKTHAEIRNSEIHRELIEITEEMGEAMQITLESDTKRFAVDDAPQSIGTTISGLTINGNDSSSTCRRTVTSMKDTREPYRRKMREKLRSDKGQKAYMKRQGPVEPGHGDDQKNRKWKQHHLRGVGKATAELVLIRITANIGKIIKFKTDELLAMQGT